jgi:Zn-dependent peptidase ImmA (M78 family)
VTLRRGFKAEAERIAAEQREFLGVSSTGPVDPFLLLDHHGITVRTPAEVAGLALMPRDTLQLLVEHSDYWSALTVRTPAGIVVVHNPQHEQPRQHSNLTHELAHVLLQHMPGALQTVAGCVMRDFDEVQEEEARCLGDTLLAPRAALEAAARRRMTLDQTADWLGASLQLTSYRAHTTGITRQYRGYA